MKSPTNLTEAVLVFFILSIIALFNVGQIWEGQKISEQYMNMELTYMLQLTDDQIDQIRSINAAYEIDLLKVKNGVVANDTDADRLQCERNKRILEVLNERQKTILHEYCTHLISYTKMAY